MTTDFEKAEQFGRARAMAAPFFGLLILTLQQGVIFAWDWQATSSGALLKIGVWLIFAIIMLFILLTGGGWFVSRKAREIADDEPSQSNRQRAINVGFVVSLITCFLVVAISPFDPLPAQRAAHIIASMGLGTAFVAFGLGDLFDHG